MKKQYNKNPLTGIFDDAFLNMALTKLSASNKNDNRISLLNSIKPFISESRQNVINEVIKALNLLIVVEKLGLKVGK